ncbi:MAG: PASTA domain-containing protein, partial [Acidimicrobiales bacterium]
PRPEPLVLASAAEVVDLTAGPGADATMHGGSAHAPSRVAEPGEVTVANVPVVAAPMAPTFIDDDLDAGDYYDPPRRRRWPIVLVTIVLASLLGIAAAWAVLEASAPRYEVPVLVGNTEAAARQAVDGYGWTIDRRTDRKDDSEPGTVLRTDPEAGDQLKKGDTLVIYVSLGNELAPVPGDLVDKTIEEATAALDAAGGFVPKVVPEFSEEKAKGIVLAVAPESSGDQAKGSEITLVVSEGPVPRTVPAGLTGKTYDEAAAALTAVQLVPVKVEDFSDTVEPGKVIGFRPGEGEEAARDSNVEVVISKGPDLVTVPSVRGGDLEDAVAALERAGLQAGDVFGPANGSPFDTDPPAGTEVKRGTTVDIYLRR